ncbi:uncharacterized protein LOC134439922 [Engraulis encrasicolus]|uniref:uncharacterized protein LOC134439922 n=1 Tax=Engraulis encrasicolus TaxID=184585 RepID=UPI002FD2028D
MYLCKNGIGVRMEKFSGSNGVDFKLSQVTQEDTGNYSCVYSEGRLVAHEITTIGQKHVFIQVKEFLSGKIHVTNSVIFEGDSVSLACTGTVTNNRPALHIYLCKNGVGVVKNVVQGKEGVQFTLEQIKKEHSGNYTCVYSFSKYDPPVTVCSISDNPVLIQVEDFTRTDFTQPDLDVGGRSRTWWVNVFRLACSAGVVMAAVAALVDSYVWSKKALHRETPNEDPKRDDDNSTSMGPQTLPE